MVMFGIKQNKKLRNKGYIRIINKQIQLYIKNGCEGCLYLHNTPISKLPKNLKYVGGGFLFIDWTNISELPNDIIINGDLWCYGTPLSRKYSKEQIKSKWKIYGNVYC